MLNPISNITENFSFGIGFMMIGASIPCYLFGKAVANFAKDTNDSIAPGLAILGTGIKVLSAACGLAGGAFIFREKIIHVAKSIFNGKNNT